MAEIRPFRGLIYNQALLGSLDRVIAPPYDVLGIEEQEFLYNLSPYNIVRLEYGKLFPDDNADNNRYSRAADTLSSWLAEGFIQPEKQNMLYLYEQSFSYNGHDYCRRGIFAALKVEPYSSGQVLPHEQTFSAPKADRFELLKSTRTNISPIFTLFPDPEELILRLLKEIGSAEPLFDIIDQSGQSHRLFKIDHPEQQKEIVQSIKAQALLIADGHHRYETALNYKDYRNEPDGSAADYILAILVSMKEPGLLMLPTHRLISNLQSETYAKLIKICNDNFDLVKMDQSASLDEQSFQAEWQRLTSDKQAFAMLTPDFNALLIPRSGQGEELYGVELLHKLIIEPFLALPETASGLKDQLTFPHDFISARQAVLSDHPNSVAFILNPIPVEIIYKRALEGNVMPQKTTFFYPKMPGGLLLRNLDLD